MARARVTYTWDNGDMVVQHHEWDDEYDVEGETDDPEDPSTSVYGYLEVTYQADYSPVREMDNRCEAGNLIRVKTEKVDG